MTVIKFAPRREHDLIRVLLVDDHHLIRAGVKHILESVHNMRIVGEADCGEDALTLAKTLSIDIAVVDVQMPGMPVQELIQRFLQLPQPIRSIVLTSTDEESMSTQLLINGAYSYVTKSCNSEHLVRAVEKTMKSERYLSPDIAKRLAYKVLHTNTASTDSIASESGQEAAAWANCLSHREIECLPLLVEGKSVKEIACLLNINPKTINTYRHRILRKLNIKNDIELVKFIARNNLQTHVTTHASV